MKNKFLFALMAVFALVACTPENYSVFEESPDERVAKVLKEYESILLGSENGWILTLETGTSGAYNHWVKFLPNNRIQMLSDAEGTSLSRFQGSSSVIYESSYRLKSVTTPILMFDTYNYIHMLADPNPSINGGDSGEGLITDFEFSLGKYSKETKTLTLKGRYNKSRATMRECTAEELAAIQSGCFKTIHTNFIDYISENYKYPVVQLNDKKVDIELSSRTAALKFINENDEIETSSSSGYLDLTGAESDVISSLFFLDPLTYYDINIDAIRYDSGKMFVQLEDGSKVEIVENGFPALPLRFGYKQDYTSMRTQPDNIEGSLDERFLTNVYNAANTSINGNGGRSLVYMNVAFQKNATSGLEEMKLVVRYKNSAGSQYNATWIFQFTKNPDGTITFTDRDQTGSSNERGQEPYVKLIPDYFCAFEYDGYSTSSKTGTWDQNKARVTKVTPHTFKLDWAENKTPGLSSSLGGFYPTEEAHLAEFGVLCGILN